MCTCFYIFISKNITLDIGCIFLILEPEMYACSDSLAPITLLLPLIWSYSCPLLVGFDAQNLEKEPEHLQDLDQTSASESAWKVILLALVTSLRAQLQKLKLNLHLLTGLSDSRIACTGLKSAAAKLLSAAEAGSASELLVCLHVSSLNTGFSRSELIGGGFCHSFFWESPTGFLVIFWTWGWEVGEDECSSEKDWEAFLLVLFMLLMFIQMT